MVKIVFKYIDFWKILTQIDKIDNYILDKLNFIGNKIIKLNQQLIINIDVVLKVNLYDLDLVKLYYHYLLEILNDHSHANKYF